MEADRIQEIVSEDKGEIGGMLSIVGASLSVPSCGSNT